MKKVLDSVLKDITPDKKESEEILGKINAFLKRLNASLGDAKAILGGSMAKGTWIRGVYDADVFVQFPYDKYKDQSTLLSDILEKRMKKAFPKLVRLHGSRDYFQLEFDKITYEIIPILNITKASQAQNITDISPLHAKWVKKNVKDVGQIRLVKAFCKAQGVYGAESYIRGFSGYVVEILTIHYGSFQRLVSAATKWKIKTIIDHMKYHKNVMFEVNQSKLVSPLILIDPVQKGRNTAAGLSDENFLKFIKACQEFLKKPSADYFVAKELSKESLAKSIGKDSSLLYLKVASTVGKEDVVGGKLLKAFDFFQRQLETHDFKIVDKGWDYDKKTTAFFWYIISPKTLPKQKVWPGPPLRSKPNVEDFKKKYKDTFIKGNRIFANVNRKYTTAEMLVKELTKDAYLQDKMTNIEIK